MERTSDGLLPDAGVESIALSVVARVTDPDGSVAWDIPDGNLASGRIRPIGDVALVSAAGEDPWIIVTGSANWPEAVAAGLVQERTFVHCAWRPSQVGGGGPAFTKQAHAATEDDARATYAEFLRGDEGHDFLLYPCDCGTWYQPASADCGWPLDYGRGNGYWFVVEHVASGTGESPRPSTWFSRYIAALMAQRAGMTVHGYLDTGSQPSDGAGIAFLPGMAPSDGGRADPG